MNIQETIIIFKALADESRLKIVKSLIEKPQYLEELSNRIALASSTTSFHLKKLEKANLVFKKKEQYYTIFSIKKELFTKTLEDLMNFEVNEKELQDQRITDYKKKIWERFTKGGYIVQLPAQKQKRWVLFERILDKFEFNKEYSELEVNTIIKEYYEDYCLVRRNFIEENVMERENSIYRLSDSYERFCKGEKTENTKHGLMESYEQAVRDKFGVR